MARVDKAFAIVVVLSIVVGGVSIASFADTLITTETTTLVADTITADVTDIGVEREMLSVTVVIRNPTDSDVRVTGAVFYVLDGQQDRIAHGSAMGFGGGYICSHGRQTFTFEIPLTPSQIDRIRRALAGGVVIESRYGMELDGVSFVVYAESTRMSSDEVRR